MEVINVNALCFMVFMVIYFIPTMVAYKRNKLNKFAVFMCNLIFGITGVGWGIALIWAVCRDKSNV